LDDRTPELEAAIRAQDAVIAEAQRLLAGCRQPGGLTRDALIDELRKLFDGRQQRMRNGSRGKRWARISATSLSPIDACPGCSRLGQVPGRFAQPFAPAVWDRRQRELRFSLVK
jgi:hypothetical protein